MGHNPSYHKLKYRSVHDNHSVNACSDWFIYFSIIICQYGYSKIKKLIFTTNWIKPEVCILQLSHVYLNSSLNLDRIAELTEQTSQVKKLNDRHIYIVVPHHSSHVEIHSFNTWLCEFSIYFKIGCSKLENSLGWWIKSIISFY